ncbi:MAG: Nif3-like dinuclear metal center hexameric protein [Clostridiales bacterium]|nr:Nif3-like dinuclear metal center hexameric protein [Clostridiales bacterium]
MGKMPTVKDIFNHLCTSMPISLCESWDNSGLLIGRLNKEVKKALISLDVTPPVVLEAIKEQFDLIVSHHPVVFRPVSAITEDTPTGSTVTNLIKNDISVISMHTNADVADGGVNDLLAERIGLIQIDSLRGGETEALGRYGVLKEQMTLHEFLKQIKVRLSLKGTRFINAGSKVLRVAVGGGACGDLLKNAKDAGCDTFITSDIKYSVMLEAAAYGMNLIDAGHFETENLICPKFAELIGNAFPEITVKIAEANRSDIEYFI